MKKLKSLAAGIIFAGTAFCVSPAVAFSPVAGGVAFAQDEVITIEEGDSFETSATITTEGYSIRLADKGADFSILSQQSYPGEQEGTYTVYATVVINTVGAQELIIEDENGDIVSRVSVKVTSAASNSDDSDDADATDATDTAGDNEDTSEDTKGTDTTDPSEASDDTQATDSQGADSSADTSKENDDVEYLVFLPISNGKISGTTESGEFKPGEKITLSLKADKGYVLNRWVVRDLDGTDVTDSLEITKDATFILPDYPIRIAAELNYNLIHEIELLDVTETLKVGSIEYDEKTGKPTIFTGHVKDNTDARFFLLAEIWINEYDTKGITSSKDINEKIQKEGVELLKEIDAGDKYNYSVMFATTEGYEFAEDVKLIYNGKEYTPSEVGQIKGNGTVTFSGFLSSGTQTNPRETRTVTRTVTKQETQSKTVTQYIYNTYTYTTYQYVTRVVQNGTTAAGTVKKTVLAPATGDTNNTAVWIALAIAAGGGVVSGILVGRRRKRNK